MTESTADPDRRAPLRRLGELAMRFGPPLAVMGLIWLGSAQERLGTDLGTLDVVLRKLAHVIEYAVLWFAWHWALRWQAPLAAAGIALAWAITDEWHQTWVDGRRGTPVDVAIDAAGIALAALAWWWWRRRVTEAPAARV